MGIRLFGAIAVRPAVVDLLSRFETETGLTVAVKWELNPMVRKQIEAGEPFDLVITNPALVQELTALGKVKPGSQAAFGRVPMGMAARAGSRPLDIGSVEVIRAGLEERRIDRLCERRNQRRLLHRPPGTARDCEVKPRLVAVSGGQTAASVGRGKAELGVVPVTSIFAAAPAVVLVGRFPADLQSTIEFDIGISADPMDADAAKRLSDFLTSAAVDDMLAAKGVDRRQDPA